MSHRWDHQLPCRWSCYSPPWQAAVGCKVVSKLFSLLNLSHGLYSWLLWLSQGRKSLGGNWRLLLVKESEERQALLDILQSHRTGSALLFHVQFLPSLWWEHLALIPPCANKLGFPHWGACCLFGCACSPQTPPASLYQHSSTAKTTPKPKRIPSPSSQLQAQWMPQLDAEQAACNQTLEPVWFLSFLCNSTEGISSPLTWVLHPHCSADIQETHPCVVRQQNRRTSSFS